MASESLRDTEVSDPQYATADENSESDSTDSVAPANAAATYEPVSEEHKERFEEVRSLLASIPTGREALSQMKQYQVVVEFRPGSGTWYNWYPNMMVIDSNKSPVEATFSFVHEMTHAARTHQGMHQTTLPRQDYIEQRLEEEAEGDVRAIEAKDELRAIGIPASVKAAVFGL